MRLESRLVSFALVCTFSGAAFVSCSKDDEPQPPAELPPLGGGAAVAGSGGASSGSGGLTSTAGALTGGSAGSSNLPAVICQNVPGGKLALIDDFEDEDSVAALEPDREGFWYTVHDDSTGGISPEGALTPVANGASGSQFAAHVVASGYSVWGASANVSLTQYSNGERCPYNASAFVGLRFLAKGTGIVSVGLPIPETVDREFGGSCDPDKGMGCYDTHSVAIVLEPEFRVYELPFSAFAQRGFGTPVDFHADGVMGLQFIFETPNLPVDLWFDDVSFWDGVAKPQPGGAGGEGGGGGGSAEAGAGGKANPAGGGEGGA